MEGIKRLTKIAEIYLWVKIGEKVFWFLVFIGLIAFIGITYSHLLSSILYTFKLY